MSFESMYPKWFIPHFAWVTSSNVLPEVLHFVHPQSSFFYPAPNFPIPVTHTVLRIKVSFYLMECAQLYFIIARKIHMPHF